MPQPPVPPFAFASLGSPVVREAGDMAFRVENFKSIAAAILKPGPLTLLAGANSSGKSSLLQSLLFLAQSDGEATAVINGDLVQLGEATDVIRDETDSLAFEFAYHIGSPETAEEPGGDTTRTLRLVLDKPQDRAILTVAELSLSHDDVPTVLATRQADIPDVPLQPNEIALLQSAPRDELVIIMSGLRPTRVLYRAGSDAVSAALFPILQQSGRGRLNLLNGMLLQIQTQVGEAVMRDLLALRERFGADEIVEPNDPLLQHVLDFFIDYAAPGGWMTQPILPPHFFGQALVIQTTETPPGARALTAELGVAVQEVTRLASSVIYLGPLRDDPRIAYPLGHTVDALPVGEKGEFTAAFVLAHGADEAVYRTPKGESRKATFRAALVEWCKHLGIADDVVVKEMGKLGHQLRLRVAGRQRDPTAIGVGASQLLPVVAVVLGAPTGSLVLLEQPELHLHPRIQSRLGDFLLQARPDIRLIVETHSEYLVTRLRLRIAEGVPASDVSVLFASMRTSADDGRAQHTEFRTLTVDQLGDFDYWPPDFFDALEADSVALARVVSARVKAEGSADRPV